MPKQKSPQSDYLIFDGKPIPIHGSPTVAGALMAADISSWRTTRHEGKPRGLFCCMGACYDCLVCVDGAPNQRACLTPAVPGMVIESSPGEFSSDDVARSEGSAQ